MAYVADEPPRTVMAADFFVVPSGDRHHRKPSWERGLLQKYINLRALSYQRFAERVFSSSTKDIAALTIESSGWSAQYFVSQPSIPSGSVWARGISNA